MNSLPLAPTRCLACRALPMGGIKSGPGLSANSSSRGGHVGSDEAQQHRWGGESVGQRVLQTLPGCQLDVARAARRAQGGRVPAITKLHPLYFATPVGVTDRCKTRRCTAIDEFGVVAARRRERAFVNARDRPIRLPARRNAFLPSPAIAAVWPWSSD